MFVRKVRLCTFVFPFVTDETEPDPFTVKEKDVSCDMVMPAAVSEGALRGMRCFSRSGICDGCWVGMTGKATDSA